MERANVARPGRGELVLVRHAPSDADNRLCGRTDVPARLGGTLGLERLRHLLADIEQRVCSPALRCRQTADALWPDGPEPVFDARLWEQNFGDHDGLRLDRLPDLGVLDAAELAAHRPPNGESFADAVARIHPALAEWAWVARGEGPVVVVGHAGTVRAALALAINDTAAALAFEIAPLSVTRLRCFDGGFSVICTNWTAR